MKHKLIAIGAGALLLVVGLQATPALAAPQVRRGNSAITFTLPLRTWVKSYLIFGMKTGKYVPHAQLSFPLLWLYNPAGQPVAYNDDSTKLKSVLAKFPESLEHAPALKGEPDLAAMSAILQKVGAKPLEQSQGKRYTAVFYTEGHCSDVCARFSRLLQAAVKQHPGKWSIVTIKLAKK